MTNFINISICIPTYNRADLLNQTLEVLYKENQSNNIEIVISDNASTDHTDKILDKWSRIFPHFVRHRFDSNQGADLNYLKAVELASGKYCWLYGSDDLVVSGAIAKLLKEIETDCDVYIFNRVECTKDMAPKRYRSWWKIPQNRIYDFSIKSHVLAYLYSCSALGGIFSFLTSVIVRKDTWNKMGVDKSYVGSAYLHIHPLLKILKLGGSLKALDDYLVLCRCGNDSFVTSSRAARINLDFRGYFKVADNLFKDWPEAYSALLNVITEEHSLDALFKHNDYVRIKQNSSFEDWEEYKTHVQRYYGRQWKLIVADRFPIWFQNFLTKVLRIFVRPFVKIKTKKIEKNRLKQINDLLIS